MLERTQPRFFWTGIALRPYHEGRAARGALDAKSEQNNVTIFEDIVFTFNA